MNAPGVYTAETFFLASCSHGEADRPVPIMPINFWRLQKRFAALAISLKHKKANDFVENSNSVTRRIS